MLTEIKFHGRGGQGAVTSAEMLALAAINEEKFAQGFPTFGPERRGAPVMSFVRIDDEFPIRTRAEISRADIVVVMDFTLLRAVNIAAGVKKGGTIIVNTRRGVREIQDEFNLPLPIATVDASAIAMKMLGVNIVNTTMLGSILKVKPLVRIESLEEPLKHRFGERWEKNYQAAKKAYEETLLTAEFPAKPAGIK